MPAIGSGDVAPPSPLHPSVDAPGAGGSSVMARPIVMRGAAALSGDAADREENELGADTQPSTRSATSQTERCIRTL